MASSPAYPPIQQKVVSGKHYAYTCFSITIRDGSGIDLGSKFHSSIIKWFNEEPLYAVVSIEKTEKAAHYQMGAIMLSPIRQDVLKLRLMSLCDVLDWNENQKKHALKVSPHNDPVILFRYCIKESNPILWRYPLSFIKLRGCWCTHKYEICKHCDPHRQYWYDNEPDPKWRTVRYSIFWSQVDREPTKFHSLLAVYDKDLIDIYGPLRPYPVIY